MMSLTPDTLAGITDSKHRQSGDSWTPGAVGMVIMGGGMGEAGRERG